MSQKLKNLTRTDMLQLEVNKLRSQVTELIPIVKHQDEVINMLLTMSREYNMIEITENEQKKPIFRVIRRNTT